MTDTAEGRISGAEKSPTEDATAASAAPTSPVSAPSEPSSAVASSSSSLGGKSDLLQKIKDLQDTQKALRDQKRKCAVEMKNAIKRKKRLQGKAAQLNDKDLVEVLRMRNEKRESAPTAANAPQPQPTQPDT